MIPSLSEALIREYATDESFRRGEDYAKGGAVVSLTHRGNAFDAEVEGSEPLPYHVRVTFDAGGITTATCSCPYDWGGWCKHVVAALLVAIRNPDEVEERPTLDALLADLDREQLQAVLVAIAERDPAVVDVIERQVSLYSAASAPAASAPVAAPRQRRTPVDASAIRRDVRAAFRSLDRMSSSEAYWHVGSVVGEVGGVLERAWEFIRAGDGESALAILEAITDEYVEDWTEVDDSDGEASAFFYELGSAWVEALLTADLTADERAEWADRLSAWALEIEDYGIDDAFDVAMQAAKVGWDDPNLRQILRGESGTSDANGPTTLSDKLTGALLNVLDRQGRHDEYLRLARATGQAERYATMLARLGRIDDAVAYGLQNLASATDALAVAQALREREALDEALQIGEHGLTLDGRKAELAVWLRDLASVAGRPELALSAGTTAFREQPSLVAYQRVQELAGERWPDYRTELLEYLRRTKSYHPVGTVDVFLHEGLIDDAIAAVSDSYSYGLIERVAEAAISARPDWVIQTCRKQAEAIMNEGKANHYDTAVRWLTHARSAYRAASREAEWQTYLADLITRHGRKYKLVPMLRTLQG
jgi:uncharacterized Zn finger protein